MSSELQGDLSSVKSQLRSRGLRATSARIAVLRAVMSADSPLSHAEAYELVKGQGFDRATVYRNLTDLVEVELLQRSDLGDHVWRFTYLGDLDANSHRAHPHFVCVDCGQVTCLPNEAVAIAKQRGIPKAVRRREVAIQMRGRCDDCE